MLKRRGQFLSTTLLTFCLAACGGGSIRDFGMMTFELNGDQTELANQYDAGDPVKESHRFRCQYWLDLARNRAEKTESSHLSRCLSRRHHCTSERDADEDALAAYAAAIADKLCQLAEEEALAKIEHRAEEAATRVERMCRKEYSEAETTAAEAAERYAQAVREQNETGKADVEAKNTALRQTEAAMRAWIERSVVVSKLPCKVARPSYSVCYNHVDVVVPCNSAAAVKKSDHDTVYLVGLQVTNRANAPLTCDLSEEHSGVVIGAVPPKVSKTLQHGQTERFTREWPRSCSVFDIGGFEAGFRKQRYGTRVATRGFMCRWNAHCADRFSKTCPDTRPTLMDVSAMSAVLVGPSLFLFVSQAA